MQDTTARDFAPDDKQSGCAATAESELEEFIYLICHDLRGSVRALLELPKWIGDDLRSADFPLGSEVEGYLDLMRRHAGRLDCMLTDLLTYSRVGRMQTIADIDVAQAIDKVLEATPVPDTFTLSRAVDCAHIRLGDRDILTLIAALIDNAVKHHDGSGGRIHVYCTRDGDDAVLRVHDDGPGIAPQFHEQVFQAMKTLRPRDEVEGSGMGLAQVRKIAEQNGGTAAVTASKFGIGTCVEIRLPCAS